MNKYPDIVKKNDIILSKDLFELMKCPICKGTSNIIVLNKL